MKNRSRRTSFDRAGRKNSRRLVGRLSIAILVGIASTAARAATNSYVLNPISDAFGTDQPRDGVFDTFFPSSPANIVGGNSGAEYRSALEFQLPNLAAGTIINSAKLDLYPVAAGGSVGTMGVSVHSYNGNGVAEIADLLVNHQIAGPISVTFAVPPNPPPFLPSVVEFDVTNAVQSFYTAGATYGGFSLRAQPLLYALQFGSVDNGTPEAWPTLTMITVPEPPAGTLLLAAAIACCLATLARKWIRLRGHNDMDPRLCSAFTALSSSAARSCSISK